MPRDRTLFTTHTIRLTREQQAQFDELHKALGRSNSTDTFREMVALLHGQLAAAQRKVSKRLPKTKST